jgi:hypothetical protein
MLVCYWCGIQSDCQYVLFEMSDLLKNPWRLTQANIWTEGVLYTYLFVFCHLQNYYLIYMPCLTKKTPDKYPNPRQEARGITLTRQREGPRLPPMQIWSEKGHGGHGRGMQSRKLASAQYRKVNWLCCRSAIHGEDGFNIPVSLRGGRGYGFGLRLDSGRMFPAGGRVDHVSRKLPLFVLGNVHGWC